MTPGSFGQGVLSFAVAAGLPVYDDEVVAIADQLDGFSSVVPSRASSTVPPMEVRHVIIVGGPEVEDELLAIVLDRFEEAIPLFDSIAEAEEFLASTGDFGKDWRAREVSARELIKLLDYQGEEVEYVALSPPPENLAGGMEVQVIHREILTDLLKRQTTEQSSESNGFWRRLFGR